MTEIVGETVVTADVPAKSVTIDPTHFDGKQRQSADPSLPARTTFQQDLISAGQRAINLKWESTQQVIAVAVSIVVLLVCAFIVVAGDVSMRSAAFLFLTNIMTGVTTTYFVRTNHTKIGGVGPNEVGR